MQLEDLIEQTGGCGRYQVILCIIVHSMKTVTCFSMLLMVFGAAKPDWWCANDLEDLNVTFTHDMPQYKSCTFNNGTSSCTKFVFDDSMKTVATQWDLVCDKAWVSSTITSLQMAGVLVGNLVCGQVADLVGRKPPLFLSILALTIFNTVSAFSTSWIMFAVLRFFIGLAMGFYLTVQYNVMSEFTQARWRTWVVAVPSWAVQTVLFAFVTWLLKNWKYVHLFTAAFGVPLLATYWFVPESFRWYVGHDRFKDAQNVIKKVARVNGKPVPNVSGNCLKKKSLDEANLKDKKYSFFDIARNRQLRIYTLLLVMVWITLGLGGYGIQFGITNLSGNLYINIFVLGVLASPLQFIFIYLQNRVGRKKAATVLYIACVITTLTVAVAYRFKESSVRNHLINTAAILALTSMNAAWSPIQTLTIETYPTVVRNIGFGLQNTMARVGAVIGPQLVFMETKVSGIMYWICAVTTIMSVFLIIPIPETCGKDLNDKIIEAPGDKKEYGQSVRDEESTSLAEASE